MLTLTIAAYTSSSVNLIFNIHRSHKMAFNSHKKSLVALFVATLASVLYYLILQLYVVSFIVCDFVGGEAMNGIPVKEDDENTKHSDHQETLLENEAS